MQVCKVLIDRASQEDQPENTLIWLTTTSSHTMLPSLDPILQTSLRPAAQKLKRKIVIQHTYNTNDVDYTRVTKSA